MNGPTLNNVLHRLERLEQENQPAWIAKAAAGDGLLDFPYSVSLS